MANTTDRIVTTPTNINMVAGGDISLNTNAGTYHGEIKDGNISNFPFPGAVWTTQSGNLTFISGVITASGAPAAVNGVLDVSNSNSLGYFTRTNNVEMLFDDVAASNGLTSIAIDTNHNIQFTVQNSPTISIAKTGFGQALVSLQNNSTVPGNTVELRFQELISNGSEFIALKAPDSITSSVTWILPDSDGTAGQALLTDGSGVLSWGNTSASNLYVSNGTLTGDRSVTMNGNELDFSGSTGLIFTITDGGGFSGGGDGNIRNISVSNTVRVGRVLQRQTVTSTIAGSLTIDWNSSDVYELTVNGDVNIEFANVDINRELTILIKMNAVGGHNVTLPSLNIQYSNGAMISVNNGPNETTEIRYKTYSSTSEIRARLLGENYA